MSRRCIITGVSGSLGAALSNAYLDYGYKVLGIDFIEPNVRTEMEFIYSDLNEIVDSPEEKKKLFAAINSWKGNSNIRILINNAAFQYINKNHPSDINKFKRSLNVNLISPYILTTHLSNDLEQSKGSVINISSIHARLTKPGFSFYSSSKAALTMLTKSLAVDFGDKFRVNCIEPAAIDTKMLRIHASMCQNDI